VDVTVSPPSSSGADDHLPSLAPRSMTLSIDPARLDEIRHFGVGDDIVEVSSTSELVEVTRAADGSITAIEEKAEVTRLDDVPAATDDAFDIDFGDLSFEQVDLMQAGPLPPADGAESDELPVVVGSNPAQKNPFLADPHMLTRKR
jgi:hypothetical protein